MTWESSIATIGLGLAAGGLALGVLAHLRHRRTRERVRALRSDLASVQGQLVMLRRELYAWRAGQMNPARLENPGTTLDAPVLRSQFGEDAFLLDLFEFGPDGFFVEAGAYDGVSLSATKVFEDLGWTGLLVEPLPERFEQCVRNRPRSRVVRAALGGPGSSGTTTFQVATSRDAGSIVDMASQRRAGAHQQGWVRENKGEFRTIEVPLTSLAALLEGRASVDLLVLDVEGAEAEALAGLDLSRHRPRVVVLEDLTRGGDQSASGLLGAAGYVECVRFGHNRVFVRLDDRALVSRARLLLAETDLAPPGFWERSAG